MKIKQIRDDKIQYTVRFTNVCCVKTSNLIQKQGLSATFTVVKHSRFFMNEPFDEILMRMAVRSTKRPDLILLQELWKD